MKKLLLTVVILMLAACADHAQIAPSAVTIAPNVNLAMPSPADLGRTIEATQLVVAKYGDRHFAFEAHISATPDNFKLAGLDLTGQRLFTIDWTPDGIAYETGPWVPDQLKPENILADIVLLYWPAPAVRKALGPSAKLVTHGHSRAIVADGKTVWRADYRPRAHDIWEGDLHYRNLAWGYTFSVQSTEQTP